jgi:hypothetical protein
LCGETIARHDYFYEVPSSPEKEWSYFAFPRLGSSCDALMAIIPGMFANAANRRGLGMDPGKPHTALKMRVAARIPSFSVYFTANVMTITWKSVIGSSFG